jgi:hypothetical protein
MKDTKTTILTATLRGIRPILFDRYAGDNKTKLPVMDKFYVTGSGHLVIPVLNVYSLLAAQNTPSVAKRFYGKQARDVALGVMSFVSIEATGDDPLHAQITDADNNPYTLQDSRIEVLQHVARVKDGVPNPKERPMLPTGWKVTLRFEHQENTLLALPCLQTMVEQGGILGLGTFRPIFGRYSVEWI